MSYQSTGAQSAENQRGFTLVEIAIVLVIAGLALGGLLKGQQIIVSAKLKRIEKDGAGIAAAMFSYQDRYLQLPGDDDHASSRFSVYFDGLDDPEPEDIDGDSDGSIDGSWMVAGISETANFWKHLRAAGLITGDGNDGTQPTNAFGGNIGVRDGSLLISGHAIVFGSIEGSIAKIIESRFDDGAPQSGRIQSDTTWEQMDGFVVSSAGDDYADSMRYFMAFRI